MTLEMYLADLLVGLGGTMAINGIGFVAGFAIGTMLGFALTSRHWWLRVLARAYVEVIRNTPFLVQAMLLVAVFGTLRIRIDPMVLGVLAITLYTAAYAAEIVRGGLAVVGRGQRDAARALGLGRLKTLRLIVVPQTLPFVIPAGTNLLATVIKESSVLSALAVAELTYAGQVVIARTFDVFGVWAIVGSLYLILVLSLIGLATLLERRMIWTVEARNRPTLSPMTQGRSKWRILR